MLKGVDVKHFLAGGHLPETKVVSILPTGGNSTAGNQKFAVGREGDGSEYAFLLRDLQDFPGRQAFAGNGSYPMEPLTIQIGRSIA
jgi:hypothetical protein